MKGLAATTARKTPVWRRAPVLVPAVLSRAAAAASARAAKRRIAMAASSAEPVAAFGLRQALSAGRSGNGWAAIAAISVLRRAARAARARTAASAATSTGRRVGGVGDPAMVSSAADVADGTTIAADEDDEASEGPRRRRKMKRNRVLRKFKAAAWMSVLIRRLCRDHIRNNEDNDSPYMRNVQFSDDKGSAKSVPGLMFDAGLFKAKREMRMSEESKRILALPPWARTETDLLHLEIVLRTIKDYAAYPVSTQRKIAEVGQYVKYEARRIIVRQGHPAWNFYFILSGAVVVLVMDGEQNFVVPKALLRRGQSFGELALISGGRRMSTVVATEDLEMLTLWHEDFKRIFDNGGIKKSEDEFIRSLYCFHGWPLQIADVCPQRFIYHYYKRGEVVVKDSSYSAWIIIVKSGSLEVIKKLRRARPSQPSPLRPSGYSPEREAWEEGNFKSVVDCKWSRLGSQSRESVDACFDVDTLPFLAPHRSPPQPQQEAQVTGSRSDDRSESADDSHAGPLSTVQINTTSSHRVCQHGSTSCRCHLIRSSSAQPKAASSRRSHATPPLLQRPRTSVHSKPSAAAKQVTANSDSFLPAVDQENVKIKATGILDLDSITKSNFKQEIRTAAGDLDKEIKFKGDTGPTRQTNTDAAPMFVRVQTLTKGQVFGLTDLVLGTQPTFSVVSNGAECIMIEKSLYTEHASDGLLKVIRDQAQAYPTDEEMQRNLQTAVDWSRYKKNEVEETHKRSARSLRSAT